MKRILFFIIGLFLLTGCSLVSTIWAQEIYDVPSGSILLKEDFSSENHGWKNWNENGSHVTYQAGAFRFYVNQSNFDYWSTPGYTFKDMRVEVEATKISGPDNNAFGVICRFVDSENFYAFLISSDGYAGILKVLDGEYTLLNANSLEFFAEINQGEALNKIVADCSGTNLSLIVNDAVLFEVEDTAFEKGDVGLMASSYDQPGVDILFDNLMVLQP